eukprot:4659896-Prymnesium_polylepis.1
MARSHVSCVGRNGGSDYVTRHVTSLGLSAFAMPLGSSIVSVLLCADGRCPGKQLYCRQC